MKQDNTLMKKKFLEILASAKFMIEMAECKDEIIATTNILMFKLRKELLKNDLPSV